MFEELEKQGFKNSGKDHISGVYQWIDKVYLAQVFNYGKRLQFDVMVPEPAALLIQASAKEPSTLEKPVPPPPLIISPLDLNENPVSPTFYGSVIKQFKVLGIEPLSSPSLQLCGIQAGRGP